MRAALRLSLAAGMAAALSGQVSAQSFTNGDFQTGDLSGWTVVNTANGAGAPGNVVTIDIDGPGPFADSLAAHFQVGNAVAPNQGEQGIEMTQLLSLTAGTAYTFDFDWSAQRTSATNNAQGGVFSLIVDGVIVAQAAAGGTSSATPHYGHVNTVYTPAASSIAVVGIRITRPYTVPADLHQYVDNVVISGGTGGTTGACCIPATLSCAVTTATACAAAGGTYNGDGSTCAAANCPSPGACCLVDGSCVQAIPAACATQNGIYRGNSTACATANCPQPATGACCFVFSACAVLTQAQCVAQNGTYAGDNITCAAANCPAPPPKVFLPNANATVAGGTSPFDTLTREFARSYQQTFIASEISIPVGANITHITFRSSNFPAANPAGPWPSVALNWADYQISLGRAAFPPGSMSLTFADNIVAGTEVVVRSGPMTIPANSFDNSAVPPAANPPGYSIPITPYTYNGGDLVMTIRHGGHGSPAFVRHFMDVVANPTLPSTQCIAFSDNVSPTGTTAQSAPAVVSLLYVSAAACYANCDGSTTQPCLNVLDFGCFLNAFAAGNTYANCDNSTTPPVLNVLDFGCFLNRFAAGCSSC